MKKILLILLLLLPFSAKAINENIGSSGNNNGYQDASGQNSSYNSSPYGVRISIVTYNKDTKVSTRVPGSISIDFWNKIPSENCYFNGQLNRFESINVNANLNLVCDGYASHNNVSTNISFAKNFYTSTSKNTIVRDAVMQKISLYASSKYDDFLKLFNTSLSQITTKCLREDVYVVVEPLVTIYQRSGKKHIAGTGTQIGKLISQNNLSFIRTIIGDGRIPLAVYTPNNMANVIGVSTGGNWDTKISRNNNASGQNIYGYSIGLFEIPGLNDGCIDRTLEKCNFTLDRSITNDCSKSTTGFIKDVGTTNDWQCIYASAYSKKTEVKEQYQQYKNNYCRIYCREDISYSFPSNNMQVQAGSYFTLGGLHTDSTLSPINITGISTCRAVGTETIINETPINISRPSTVTDTNVHYFEEDMQKATTKAERDKIYNELMECYNFQKTYSEFSPTLNFSYNEGQYNKSGTSYAYTDSLKGTSSTTSKSSYINSNNIVIGTRNWASNLYDSSNKLIYKKDNSTGSYGSTKSIYGYAYPTAIKVEQVTKKEINYQLKSGLYNYVNKPSGISTNTPYSSNYYTVGFSNLPISYARENRNDYTFKLGFTSSWFGKDQRFYKFLTNQYKIDIEYNTAEGVDVDDLYKKIATNNTALNAISDDKSGYNLLNKEFETQLNKLGYTITDFLKTSCAEIAGCVKYNPKDESEPNGIICKADIKNNTCSADDPSGCNQNYQILKACIKSNYVTSTGSVAFSNTDLNYSCTYEVTKGITGAEDDGNPNLGIDVVYRPISLDDPFPNRESGSNWSNYDIVNEIQYNRGVYADKLYTERDPLYSMVMTPEVTKKIRKYNETHEYPDFTLDCNKEGGKCLSEFLRGSEFGVYIKGCGIKAKASGLKCEAGETW